MTSATLMATAADGAILESGGKNDPQFGGAYPFPPVKVDQTVADGDRVALGGSILIARVTPGHTPGCTTWTMRVLHQRKAYEVVFAGSPTVPPGYRLAANAKYPNAIEDYRRTFAILRTLPCDVFLAAHGNFFDLLAKRDRLAKQPRPNPFIDPEGFRRFVRTTEQQFEEAVRQQTGAQPK